MRSPHRFVTFLPPEPVYTGRPERRFGLVWSRWLSPAESNQNNIRSAAGTPLDSGRFRHAPSDSERNEVLTSIVVSIVRTCTRFATLVVLLSLVLAIGAGYYTAHNFSINTDINKLISPDLDWRKRDNQFEQAFDREKLILAVVEAPTPELTSAAAKALADKAVGRHQEFRIGAAARLRRVL